MVFLSVDFCLCVYGICMSTLLFLSLWSLCLQIFVSRSMVFVFIDLSLGLWYLYVQTSVSMSVICMSIDFCLYVYDLCVSRCMIFVCLDFRLQVFVFMCLDFCLQIYAPCVPRFGSLYLWYLCLQIAVSESVLFVSLDFCLQVYGIYVSRFISLSLWYLCLQVFVSGLYIATILDSSVSRPLCASEHSNTICENTEI